MLLNFIVFSERKIAPTANNFLVVTQRYIGINVKDFPIIKY